MAVGILLVVVGLIVAKLVEVALRFIPTRIRFDTLIERAGIDKALQRIGVRQQLNSFIPRRVYFLILFVLANTAVDALGLIAISDAIGAFFAYLPNIIAALLLMMLGKFVAQFGNRFRAGARQNRLGRICICGFDDGHRPVENRYQNRAYCA